MGIKYDPTTGLPSNDNTDYNTLLDMWRDEKEKNVERFVIHSTYKRLIRNGTKPSTFFLKEI